jgi:penicillin-binding protein 2
LVAVTELKNTASQLHTFRERTWVIGWVVLIALCLLGARAFVLQVYRHDQLMQQAESNRTALLPVSPQRGRILDRNGVVMAENQSVFTLEIIPTQTPNLQQTLQEVGELIEIMPRDLSRFNRLMRESRRFESLPLRTRLTGDEMSIVAANLYRLPGVDIQARRLRLYPLGETASHVIGHVGRINQRERDRMANWPDEQRNNYLGTDHIGKLGVELGYEGFLHGTIGFERVETAASGRAVRTLETIPPTPGDSVHLSIDAQLQHLVEKLYGNRRGALVAIDPRNGEVLAFVSMPTFNPNVFVEGIDTESWRLLNESVDKPLLNRALRGLYPPGSTYKPFMALAGLELGLRTPDTAINDPGFWVFANHRFRSVGERNLGLVDLRRSLKVSSNVYYYTLANDMGIQAIHDFMQPLGFGQATGIDLPGEVRGVLPSPEWKRNAFERADQQRWFAGETISVGIGQGYNAFTMLQLANATATLANGGTAHRPHVGLSTQSFDGGQQILTDQAPSQHLGYKASHVQAVIEGMEWVNTEGTAQRVFAGAPYRSGGKTGTAQAVGISQREQYDAEKLEEHQRSHSLYMAFAPLDNPTIAVAVIVENAGFGSVHAAPLVRRVFDYWLLGLYPSEEDIAATQQGLSAAPIGQQRKASEVSWPGNALRE